MTRTFTKQVIWSNYEELATLDPKWLVFNAPRPIYGTKRWNGPFLDGVFWAGLDPSDTEGAWCIKENCLLQASLVRYVTLDEVKAWVEVWALDHFKDRGEKFILSVLNDMSDRQYWQHFTRENIVTVDFNVE